MSSKATSKACNKGGSPSIAQKQLSRPPQPQVVPSVIRPGLPASQGKAARQITPNQASHPQKSMVYACTQIQEPGHVQLFYSVDHTESNQKEPASGTRTTRQGNLTTLLMRKQGHQTSQLGHQTSQQGHQISHY